MPRNIVLGDIAKHTSLLVRNYPTVTIYDPLTGEVIDEARPNDVPDQVVLNAVLSSGATLSYKLHGTTAFDRDSKLRDASHKPKIPAIEWRIFGSHGQIRITSYDGMCNTWSLNYGQDRLEVEIYDARTDTLTQLPTVEDDFAHLPAPARNMARLYEAFARAKAGQADSWYPDFEYGVKKHELIDTMYKENDM
jgi:predicted dehydrogenase